MLSKLNVSTQQVSDGVVAVFRGVLSGLRGCSFDAASGRGSVTATDSQKGSHWEVS